MYEVPHRDISILGTRAMLGKHNEHLVLEYVYIDDFILNPVTKCKWVRQIILLGHRGSCTVVPPVCYGSKEEVKPNEIHVPFPMTMTGHINISYEPLLTRSRKTSDLLSLSYEDYAYLKYHWDGMSIVDRFWWMYDHGLYKRFIEK